MLCTVDSGGIPFFTGNLKKAILNQLKWENVYVFRKILNLPSQVAIYVFYNKNVHIIKYSTNVRPKLQWIVNTPGEKWVEFKRGTGAGYVM